MTLTELKEIINLLQGLVLPILSYGIWLLVKIREQLQTLNGRVTRLEAWTKGHEKLDDERTENIRQEVRDCTVRKNNKAE